MTMKDFLLISPTSISKVNNAEYLNFAQGVFGFLPRKKEEEEDLPEIESVDEGGCPSLGLSAEFVSLLESDISALSNAINETQASADTPDIVLTEAGRTSVAKYMLRHVDNSAELPIEEKSKPAKQVKRITNGYSELPYLPQGQKTVKIQSMILDLRKEDIASAVSDLGLDEYVNELETLNNAFIKATASRISERAANISEKTSSIRERLEEEIEELKIVAQSYNVIHPSEEAATFIRRFNQLVEDTVTAYNMRKKNSSDKSKKDKPEESDRPVIPEEGEKEDHPAVSEGGKGEGAEA